MPPQNDIRYGDIVATDFRIDEKFVVVGRAVGKLDANSSYKRSGTNTYVYVVELPKAMIDANETLRTTAAFYSAMLSDSKFEWGSVTGEHCISVDESEIRNVIDDTCASMLRNTYGRCPRCGDAGYWKGLALHCRFHGMYI